MLKKRVIAELLAEFLAEIQETQAIFSELAISVISFVQRSLYGFKHSFSTMIFTVNVMDWQQSVLDNSHSVSNDVWKHTLLMLEILQMHDVQASFFIPINVASKYPVLVRKIHTAGHEIACLLESPYEKSSIQGKVQNGVHLLEDITENKIIGVRHLRLPIQHTDFDYYCSVLRKLGIQYDSSLVTNKSTDALESNYPSLAAFKAYGISQYPYPDYHL